MKTRCYIVNIALPTILILSWTFSYAIKSHKITPESYERLFQFSEDSDQNWNNLRKFADEITGPNLNNWLQPRVETNNGLFTWGPFSPQNLREPNRQELQQFFNHTKKWLSSLLIELGAVKTGGSASDEYISKAVSFSVPFAYAVALDDFTFKELSIISDALIWIYIFDDAITKSIENKLEESINDAKYVYDLAQFLEYVRFYFESGLDGIQNPYDFPTLDNNNAFYNIANLGKMTLLLGLFFKDTAPRNLIEDSIKRELLKSFDLYLFGLVESARYAPRTTKEFLDRHAYTEDVGACQFFRAISEVIDLWKKNIDISEWSEMSEYGESAQLELRKVSQLSNLVIVLANDAMIGKDINDIADETFFAPFLKEELCTNIDLDRLNKGHLLPSFPSIKTKNDLLKIAKDVCSYDLSKPSAHLNLLKKYLGSEIGFDAFQLLNSKIKISIEYFFIACEEYIESANNKDLARLKVKNYMRWTFGYYFVNSSIIRYGIAFELFKASAIDNNLDDYRKVFSKLDVKQKFTNFYKTNRSLRPKL